MNKTPEIEAYLQEMRIKGGKSRWKKMSPEKKKEHISMMLKKRWEGLKEKGLAKEG